MIPATTGLINDNIIEIGPISAISQGDTESTITCSPAIVLSNSEPPSGAFVLFSKDNAANMSSPVGYYAQAKFVNDSLIKSEMFSAACGVFVSSK